MMDRLQDWLDSKLCRAVDWVANHALVVALFVLVGCGLLALGDWLA
jgi:hypothetical protein